MKMLNPERTEKKPSRTPPKEKKSVSIRLDTENYRKHPARNQELIRASLERVGAFRSIAVDGEGIVRAGNGVYEQAKLLGLKVRTVEAAPDELIAVVRPDLVGEEARLAGILDNRSSETSEWDYVRLAALKAREAEALQKLKAFSEGELSAIRRFSEAASQETTWVGDDGGAKDMAIHDENLRPFQERWKAKAGQIWEIASINQPGIMHRLICGKAEKAETWKKLLAGKKVNGIITSPPYADRRDNQYGGITTAEYLPFWGKIQEQAGAALTDPGSFFLNIKPHVEDGERVLYVMDLVLAMKRKWEWKFIEEFSWTKPGIPGFHAHRFKNGFEPVYQFSKTVAPLTRHDHVKHLTDAAKMSSGSGYRRDGSGKGLPENLDVKGLAYPSNVVQASGGTFGHAAPFPVALCEFFILAFSDPKDIWLDPFAGSSTLIAAAEKNSRIGYGIDHKPEYVSLSLERLSRLGMEPKLVKR